MDTRGSVFQRRTSQRGRLHILRQPSPWSLTAGLGERLKDALMSLLRGNDA